MATLSTLRLRLRLSAKKKGDVGARFALLQSPRSAVRAGELVQRGFQLTSEGRKARSVLKVEAAGRNVLTSGSRRLKRADKLAQRSEASVQRAADGGAPG